MLRLMRLVTHGRPDIIECGSTCQILDIKPRRHGSRARDAPSLLSIIQCFVLQLTALCEEGVPEVPVRPPHVCDFRPGSKWIFENPSPWNNAMSPQAMSWQIKTAYIHYPQIKFKKMTKKRHKETMLDIISVTWRVSSSAAICTLK